MNSLDRFLFADGLIKAAWGEAVANTLTKFTPNWAVQNAPGWGTVGRGALTAADWMTDWGPTGLIKNIGKGIYHGSKGQWGSALADVGVGVAGMAGLGWAAKGLRAARAARLAGTAGEAALKGVGMASKVPMVTKGISLLKSPTKALTESAMAGSVGKAVAARPLTTAVGTTAAGLGAQGVGKSLQSAADLAREGEKQTDLNMQGLMQRIHQAPVFQNPMYANHSTNANYADVTPPESMQESGSGIANSFLSSLGRFLTPTQY